MTAATAVPADRHRSAAGAAVPSWVRLGLVALAVPQAATGLWAIVDSSGWYESFPGWDPRLVAAEPPFNAHLAGDAGAGFLATAVALLLAAWWADRRTVAIGLLTYLAFAVPHLAYHAFEPAPGLSDSQNVTNVVTLAVAVLLPAVLWWGVWRARQEAVR